MSFTSSRALHSLGVAKLMQFWSNELGGFDPDEMFVLGWLHDVGYAVAWGDNETRTKVGAFLLSMLGYSRGLIALIAVRPLLICSILKLSYSPVVKGEICGVCLIQRITVECPWKNFLMK